MLALIGLKENMHKHKLKRHKQQCIELDQAIIDAIDRTIETAILSKLSYIDSQTTKTIRACITDEKTNGHTDTPAEIPIRKFCNPEAGP